MKIKIIKKEDLPSTTNAWGFAGSINRKRMELSNGDVIKSGTACYRHLSPQKWVDVIKDGVSVDREFRSMSDVRKWYKKQGIEIEV